MRRLPLRVASGALAVLAVGALVSALTATNSVSGSNAGRSVRAITLNDLKPSACAGLVLTGLVSGSGNVSGTNDNELVLGSALDDSIRGMGGDDCILGGGADDRIHGGNGYDVCIGGPGTDDFTACEVEIQ